MTLTLRVSGGSDGLRQFAFMSRAVRWADEVGPLVRTALKRDAPVGKGPRAGRFRDNIRYARTTSAGRVRAEFRVYVPYGQWVIAPTKPHPISAVAARSLHWVDGDGASHFARTVQHPGTPGNPFHLATMRRMEPIATAAFRRIMEE